MKRGILLAIGAVVVLVGSLALGTTYLVGERIERENADVASRELVATVVGELKSGQTATYESLPLVDLATGLNPFVLIFDETDRAIAGTGFLRGKLGTVSRGILADTRAAGTRLIAWQPEPGLRFATVQVAVDGYVVVAGQSLKPSEENTEDLGMQMAAAWLSLIVTVAAGLIMVWILAPGQRAAAEPEINR